ncbi:MAG: hypothetical protein GY811_07190 [Myxococcales bacterium]|nr:hypothetical protein [Myxococcales bacterium]
MRKLASFFSLVVVLGLLVLVAQNLHTTELQFLIWGWKMSLAVPIVCAYALGGLTARSLYRLLNGQRKQRSTERKAQQKGEANVKKEEAQAAENKVHH